MIKDFFLLKHKDLLVQVYLDVFCVWDLVQSIILYNTLPINNRSVVGCKLKVMGTRLIRNQDKQKNKGNLIIVMSNFAKKEGGGLSFPWFRRLSFGDSRSEETYWRMMVPQSSPPVTVHLIWNAIFCQLSSSEFV